MTRPSRLACNCLEDELAHVADFCRERDVGLEVTAFAYPGGLDRGFGRRLRRHAELLPGVRPLSLHGPFLDLYPASVDPAVVAVARDRHERAFDAAVTLGAEVYVAHVGSVPLIRRASYRESFVARTVEFWLGFADHAHAAGLVIALENLWEPAPDVQAAIVERAAHRAIRASFDNGHALVFGESSASDWIATLGGSLAHCHLHDNDGRTDQHLPVGLGTEDWPALFGALEAHAPEALAVLESDTLLANRASLEAVLRLGSTGRDENEPGSGEATPSHGEPGT
ncbi:MAG: sugar phosphate isomerase/epimerase [Gemmatimonadota bacterium]|jgi:sugar phosphate isomerase/epimerase